VKNFRKATFIWKAKRVGVSGSWRPTPTSFLKSSHQVQSSAMGEPGEKLHQRARGDGGVLAHFVAVTRAEQEMPRQAARISVGIRVRSEVLDLVAQHLVHRADRTSRPCCIARFRV
jgi:hypothetical protein